jgi:PelA/Pel-15E family pectate lyase
MSGGSTGTTTGTGGSTGTTTGTGGSTGTTTGTGGSTGTTTGTGGSITSGDLKLPQDGNPVHARFDKYKEFASKVDNILSFQLTNGGWPKNQEYGGMGKGGSDSGTFDNGATTMELTVMADAYKKTKDKKYLDSARKAMDFILKAQYPSGGWPQFYPLKSGYYEHVTFNDDAMSRVLTLLQHAADKTDPFDTDVFTEAQRAKFQQAIDGGVAYILKAQITQNGKKTVWCAQHGATDYEPKKARAYEHPSLSGSESIEVIGFLMTQPQTPEIKKAVMDALAWFRSPTTYLADHTYDSSKEDSNPFVPKVGSKVWYRFYDIPTNQPIFSNYDGKIWLGLENQGKRKSGYRWGGEFGPRIFSYAEKVGY